MRVGRYALVDKLHEGVLGASWTALDEASVDPGMVVSLRWIPLDENVTVEVAEGMSDEAQSAVRYHHELLVPVEDAVLTIDGLAIVSEYVEGETLKSLLWRAGLKRKPIPPRLAVRATLDLLDSLAALQEQSPPKAPPCSGARTDNVLVSIDGRTRLIEPGVSRYATTVDPWLKNPKWACYAAPEALREAEEGGGSADVFTVGVMLWEMLRNRPLFGGGRYEAVARAVQGSRIARVDTLRPAGAEPLSTALADVVEQALQRTVADRFESVADMTAALRETDEGTAGADDVADYLEEFAGESLSQQRKAVSRAIGVWAERIDQAVAKAAAAAADADEEEPADGPGHGADDELADDAEVFDEPSDGEASPPSGGAAPSEDEPASSDDEPAPPPSSEPEPSDDGEGADAASPKADPSDPGFGLMSIADEPTQDQIISPYRPGMPIPPAPKVAPRKAEPDPVELEPRVSGRTRVVVVVVLLLLAAVLIVWALGSGDDGDGGPAADGSTTTAAASSTAGSTATAEPAPSASASAAARSTAAPSADPSGQPTASAGRSGASSTPGTAAAASKGNATAAPAASATQAPRPGSSKFTPGGI